MVYNAKRLSKAKNPERQINADTYHVVARTYSGTFWTVLLCSTNAQLMRQVLSFGHACPVTHLPVKPVKKITVPVGWQILWISLFSVTTLGH